MTQAGRVLMTGLIVLGLYSNYFSPHAWHELVRVLCDIDWP